VRSRASEPARLAVGDSALRKSMTTIADDLIYGFDAYRSQSSENSTGETSPNRDHGFHGTGKRKRQATDQTVSKNKRPNQYCHGEFAFSIPSMKLSSRKSKLYNSYWRMSRSRPLPHYNLQVHHLLAVRHILRSRF